MTKRAIEAVLARPWAITDEALETIAAVAEREHEYAGRLEALEAKLGRPLGNTMTASVRDGIATIPVEGPLFAKANIMTAISGATSYDMLAQDFTAAMEDPGVQGIILNIDSPGGSVDGSSEFAAMVRAARGVKPVVAYIGGTGASAAYWIASAADRIVAADTARIGSIGVQMGMTIKDPQPGARNYRFVSSNAPNKNADPSTDAGAREAQATVDDLEKVFVSTIAENRGVEAEKVIQSYGQGAVFVAAAALERGMIDAIGSYETVFSTMSNEVTAMDYKQLTVAALTENRPDLVAAIREEAVASVDLPAARAAGAQAERERIAGIEALAMPGAEAVIAAAKADPAATAEATAVKVLAVLRAAPPAASAAAPAAAALQAIQQSESALTPPAALPPAAPAAEADPADAVLAAAQAAGVLN